MSETATFVPDEAEKFIQAKTPERNNLWERLKLIAKNIIRRQAEIPTSQETSCLIGQSNSILIETLNELSNVHNELQDKYDQLEEVTLGSDKKCEHHLEQTKKTLTKVGEKWDGKEALSYDNLVFVRCSEYYPNINDDGKVSILTGGTATDGKLPRFTSHWTANHLVEPVNEGLAGGSSWEDASIVYLVPANKMIDQNGKPENFLEIDTFWTKDPVLPPGTVVVTKKQINDELSAKLKNAGLIIIGADNARTSAKKAIDYLGYTEFTGGNYESRDPEVARAMRQLGTKEGYANMAIHASNRFNSIEKTLMLLDDKLQNPNWYHDVLENDEKSKTTDRFYDRLSEDIDCCIEWLKNDDFPNVNSWVSQRLMGFITQTLPDYVSYYSDKKKDHYIPDRFGRSMDHLFEWLTSNQEQFAHISDVQKQTLSKMYQKGLLKISEVDGKENREYGEAGLLGYYVSQAMEKVKDKIPEEWYKI